MAKRIAIDLGTSSVLIYGKERGVVLSEPCVVAIDKATGKIIKYGKDAIGLVGRTGDNIAVVRPLRDGVISQYQVTIKMLQHFLKKSYGTFLLRPIVTVCVPSEISDVEEHAVVRALAQVGAKETYLIEEPLAAAIGAGIDVLKTKGSLVIDIGGGTTDIAVVSFGGIALSSSVKVGGEKMNEAIIRYVRRKHGMVIGESAAEEAKIGVGSVWKRSDAKTVTIKGKDLKTGTPKVITLASQDMVEALEEPITLIIEKVCSLIEQTPPELVSEIAKNGITLTGGASMIYGIDKLVSNVTGISARIAPNPLTCVVMGAGNAEKSGIALNEGRLFRLKRRSLLD